MEYGQKFIFEDFHAAPTELSGVFDITFNLLAPVMV